jgi:hypothetical protein
VLSGQAVVALFHVFQFICKPLNIDVHINYAQSLFYAFFLVNGPS